MGEIMAQRRMFSIKIINSARFIKMPASARLLYYDLGMHADDDGIVEAFTIMRSTGSSEDDLKILVAKGFIKILNEDLVTYILDWNEHNYIRADRKVNSIYKNLLLQLLPEAQLIEPKIRADTCKKHGQPMDSQWTAQVRLGKVRLGKVRLGKVRLNKKKEKIDKDIVSFKKDTLNYSIEQSFLSKTYNNNFTDFARERKGIKYISSLLMKDFPDNTMNFAERFLETFYNITQNKNHWLNKTPFLPSSISYKIYNYIKNEMVDKNKPMTEEEKELLESALNAIGSANR